MELTVKFVQKRASGYRYRRHVPPALRHALGWEIVIELGKTEADMIRNYTAVHAEAERRLSEARKPSAKKAAPPLTDLERHQQAMRQVAGWNLMDPDEIDATVDSIKSRYRVYDYKDEDGRPAPYREPLSDQDAATVQVLMAPDRKPEPTLEDARRLYIKERVGDDKTKEQRVDRVVGFVVKALDRNPELASLKRADAREVRDLMLDELPSAATVKRYLNDIRAIVGLGIKEFDLSCGNPFMGLEVKLDGVRKDDRKPFTEEQLVKVRQRVLNHASDDLQRVWRILEMTGCRVREVTGLLVSDVVLDHKFPHIDLVFHPHRRLKTAGSVRKVPLIGDALIAAREAVAAAGDNPLLFPIYGRDRGGDAASAAMMKHVRVFVSDKKVTNHSLRHRMADRLLMAGVEDGIKNMIVGWSKGNVSERYGGDDARLEVATKAMLTAFPEAV